MNINSDNCKLTNKCSCVMEFVVMVITLNAAMEICFSNRNSSS